MKALIVSDSHGLTMELQILKDRHQHEVDIMLHCGDSELAITSKEMSGFSGVRGNCDYDSNYPNDMPIPFGGKQILLTHGHLYNVKMTLMNLRYRAEEVGANIVCFGHSHIADAELIDNILFINPGSIRLPKMRKERTYAILEIINNEAIVTYYDLDGNSVDQLTLRTSL
ncbi:metallophosphoesterase family protein [Fredinandcohnia quinoae]|uniref:Phosphoesterase n=1 Tax=Fredinandcohnia quinoae TaxID=2918902 RepID=A0AAW5ECI0_9BACI|nr:metallophosphoesterase [Fredinandcohnia sp. SECRCQ15]MCH1627607.1 metallophosphoesterase [Fredinandcohnia sp. SECRCQ15]